MTYYDPFAGFYIEVAFFLRYLMYESFCSGMK